MKYVKEESEVLNENNIVQRLAEVEEYVNTLLLQVSYKRQNKNASLAAIPIDTLPQKDFRAEVSPSKGKVEVIESTTTDDTDLEVPLTQEQLMERAMRMVDRKAEDL